MYSRSARPIKFSRNSAGVMQATTPFDVGSTAFPSVIEPADLETLISVQADLAGAANVVTVQISNDGTNWINHAGLVSGNGGASAATITTNGITIYAVQARYVRFNITSYVSGTVVLNVHLFNGSSI